MPRTGRPPMPVELKRRLGNPGKRPLPDPVTVLAPLSVIDRPATPDDGEALIAALLEAGAAAWIGTTDQLATLRLLQDGWDRRARLMTDIDRHGHTYAATGQGGTRHYPRPEVAILRDLERQITVWLSQLGLNPADRGRLGLAQVKARSKLEELRDRRARMVGPRAG